MMNSLNFDKVVTVLRESWGKLSNNETFAEQNIRRIDKVQHKSLLSDNIKNRLVRMKNHPITN
jgi:hypothetical protein